MGHEVGHDTPFEGRLNLLGFALHDDDASSANADSQHVRSGDGATRVPLACGSVS